MPQQVIGSCGDSPLSITASVLSILTFFYAIALGTLISLRTVLNSAAEFERLLKSLRSAHQEFQSLHRAPQLRSVNERFGTEANGQLYAEDERLKDLAEKLWEQLQEWDPVLRDLEAVARSARAEEKPRWEVFDPFGPYGRWSEVMSERYPRLAMILMSYATTYFLRGMWNLLSLRRRVCSARLVLKQNELLDKMRKTEDLMTKVRMNTMRRTLEHVALEMDAMATGLETLQQQNHGDLSSNMEDMFKEILDRLPRKKSTCEGCEKKSLLNREE